jgi:hypothetical protein
MNPFQTNVKAWASARPRAIRKFRLTRVTRIFQLSVFTEIALAAVGTATAVRAALRFLVLETQRRDRCAARSLHLRRHATAPCSVPVIGLLSPVILSGVLDFLSVFQIVTRTAPVFFPVLYRKLSRGAGG